MINPRLTPLLFLAGAACSPQENPVFTNIQTLFNDTETIQQELANACKNILSDPNVTFPKTSTHGNIDNKNAYARTNGYCSCFGSEQDSPMCMWAQSDPTRSLSIVVTGTSSPIKLDEFGSFDFSLELEKAGYTNVQAAIFQKDTPTCDGGFDEHSTYLFLSSQSKEAHMIKTQRHLQKKEARGGTNTPEEVTVTPLTRVPYQSGLKLIKSTLEKLRQTDSAITSEAEKQTNRK